MSLRTEAGELLTTLVLQIFQLRGRLLAAGDATVADTGQTSARWQVLGSIAHEPMTVADIARRTGRRRQSVQELANRLCADRLIRFDPHPGDRRTQLTALTESGQALLAELTARQVAWINQLSAGLEPAEIAAAIRVLDALGERLEGTSR